jgi:tRNA nucleotidyltransferase/poly(A) polymerase
MTDQLNKTRNELLTKRWTLALMSRANVFLVGGVVRDGFLNKPIKDVDLVVEGLSFNEIKKILLPFGKVDIHGESFSVLVFKPIDHKGEPFEIATPRMDRKIGEGHKGFEVVTEGVTIEEDLKRRDFTINSIALNLKTNQILDPFNGLEDLKNGLLKATDSTAFVEDPLRILRGVQFASRFGFRIEENTLQMMRDNASSINQITGERIFDEFVKITDKKGDTKIALQLMNDSGIDIHLFGRSCDVFAMGGLDRISFFFTLGLITDEPPHSFLKRRLKADGKITMDVEILDNILSELGFGPMEDEDLRFFLSRSFSKSHRVMESILLPSEVKEVIKLMDKKIIPLNFNDLPISGEDIMSLFNLSPGPKIGEIQRKILKDALMQKFNWKNRDSCIDHLMKTS